MKSRQATRHRPGEAIPELDIYGCDGSCEHSFSATTLGEFPPMPEGCEGSSWVPTQHGETGPAEPRRPPREEEEGTHVTLELLVFSCLALGVTTLTVLLPGVVASRLWAGLPFGLAALAGAALLSAVILGDASAAVILGGAAVAATALTHLRQRGWSWMGAQLFAMVVLASVGYLTYAALQSYDAGLGPGAMVASTLLLVLEFAALGLSVSYAFQIVHVLGRRDNPRPAVARDAPEPWVALQLPTYNEPVELVQRTLEALARVDYPNLCVQVVDNNTKDEALWRPVEELCARLGPRFTFLHLDPSPGFKAGPLNEATRRLPDHIEIIGIVDADYDVVPHFLRATIPHFSDPRVAFVQLAALPRLGGQSLPAWAVLPLPLLLRHHLA